MNKKWIPGVGTLHLYKISTDGGRSWTEQWLTDNERDEHLSLGYIIKEV